MFEKLRIKEHMEVADANGRHLGTVDELDGDTIKLTRSDSSDGAHHYIPFDSVDRIEDNRVYQKSGAPAPEARVAEQFHASGTQKPFNSGQTPNPNEYSTQRPSSDSASADQPLFGTSGHGTGVGGSGVGH
jgi:hypothetical protein